MPANVQVPGLVAAPIGSPNQPSLPNLAVGESKKRGEAVRPRPSQQLIGAASGRAAQRDRVRPIGADRRPVLARRHPRRGGRLRVCAVVPPERGKPRRGVLVGRVVQIDFGRRDVAVAAGVAFTGLFGVLDALRGVIGETLAHSTPFREALDALPPGTSLP